MHPRHRLLQVPVTTVALGNVVNKRMYMMNLTTTIETTKQICCILWWNQSRNLLSVSDNSFNSTVVLVPMKTAIIPSWIWGTKCRPPFSKKSRVVRFSKEVQKDECRAWSKHWWRSIWWPTTAAAFAIMFSRSEDWWWWRFIILLFIGAKKMQQIGNANHKYTVVEALVRVSNYLRAKYTHEGPNGWQLVSSKLQF